MDIVKQLKILQSASGLTQTELANRLEVSFVSLNSWINARSVPRKSAIARIEKLLIELTGSDLVEEEAVQKAKSEALKKKFSLDELLKSKEKLNSLILLLTYHTNTIEGSTMTLADTEAVIFHDRVLHNRTQVEQLEARNHQSALLWLLNRLSKNTFKVNEEVIQQLHTRLMSGILSDAGDYRRHAVRIAGSRVVVANYIKIPNLISKLTSHLTRTKAKDSIAWMANAHSRFEQIHPFSDGNGRIGRLIMLAMAIQANLTPPIISREKKFAYYKYLEAAQIKDVFTGLELLIAQSVIEADRLLN